MIHLDDATVAELLDLPSVTDAVQAALLDLAAGQAATPWLGHPQVSPFARPRVGGRRRRPLAYRRWQERAPGALV